jgi:Flp pilus assembly pilin Flp
MQNLFLKIYVSARMLLQREEAQSLVDYALCFTIIALGTVAGMHAIASSINHSLIAVSGTFTSTFD